MYTIKENTTIMLEIKKSKFISKLYRVNDINNVKEILNEVKKEYKDATHYCYAYIIDNEIKSSDDGEPSRTAGIPMLEVLTKNNLNYVLCIVIRYFGGIKLGSGGLIRAYRKAVLNTLKEAEIIELSDGYHIKIISDYENQKTLDNILKTSEIIKDYEKNIVYYIKCSKEILDKLSSFEYEILDEIKIEKGE